MQTHHTSYTPPLSGHALLAWHQLEARQHNEKADFLSRALEVETPTPAPISAPAERVRLLRKDAIKYLGVSYSTMVRYDKQGITMPYQFSAHKVYYYKDQLDKVHTPLVQADGHRSTPRKRVNN